MAVHPHLVRDREAVRLASLPALAPREILWLAVGLPPRQGNPFRTRRSMGLVETPVGTIQVFQHVADGGGSQIAQPGQILVRVHGSLRRLQEGLELAVKATVANRREPLVHGLPTPAGVHSLWVFIIGAGGTPPASLGRAGHAVAPVVVRQEQIPHEPVGTRRLGTQLRLPAMVKPHPVPLTADRRGCCCRIGFSSLGWHFQPACQGVVKCSTTHGFRYATTPKAILPDGRVLGSLLHFR